MSARPSKVSRAFPLRKLHLETLVKRRLLVEEEWGWSVKQVQHVTNSDSPLFPLVKLVCIDRFGATTEDWETRQEKDALEEPHSPG